MELRTIEVRHRFYEIGLKELAEKLGIKEKIKSVSVSFNGKEIHVHLEEEE